MKDSVGQESVRAWLVMATLFVLLAVLGLLAEWDGLTRSAIIASSITLLGALGAMVASFAGLTRTAGRR